MVSVILAPLGDDFSAALTFWRPCGITRQSRKTASRRHGRSYGRKCLGTNSCRSNAPTRRKYSEQRRALDRRLGYHQDLTGKKESSSSIPLNERDISKGCQSIKTAETNNTAVTTSCDEEEELVDTAVGNEEEHSSTADEGTFETTCFDVGNSEGSAFETFDANTRVYHRNVEIFKPDDPPQRSIPPPELGVKGAIALDHRVLSSSSKESSFSIFSGTTNAADRISNIASVLENSVFSEDDEAEKKHAVHSKHRHAIFCFLVLILLVGATAFIFFGTGLANSMKEKSSPRGQEGTDTSVTTSSDDDSSNPSPGPVTSRETGI